MIAAQKGQLSKKIGESASTGPGEDLDMLEEEDSSSPGTSIHLGEELRHEKGESRVQALSQDAVMENMDVLLADLMQTSSTSNSSASRNLDQDSPRSSNTLSYQSLSQMRPEQQQDFQRLLGEGDELFPGMRHPGFAHPFHFDSTDPRDQHLDPSLAGVGNV